MQQNIYTIVKKHVDDWDPEELLSMGAPNDEYDIEVNEIVMELKDIENIFQLSKTIKAVFENYFCIEYDANECFKVAEGIWNDLESL